MRTMMKVQISAEAGNRAIKDGSLPEIIRKTLEAVQAEAAYFTAVDGKRTMFAVFDLKAARTFRALPSRCSWGSTHRSSSFRA